VIGFQPDLNTQQHTMTINQITRRRMLRGCGVALGLPYLESLARAAQASHGTAKPPVRAAFLHFPNGIWEADWNPIGTGKTYQLSKTLAPLRDIKDDVLVCTGLGKPHSDGGDGHYSKTANFLTGMTVKKTGGKDISAGGVSVDQLMAQASLGKVQVPSLVLGVYPVDTGIDRSVGYTHAYGSYVSWESMGRPVTPEIRPSVVYETLFGSGSRQKQTHLNRHLLDYVLEDAKSVRAKLGRQDQHKMDEYLDSVRSIEYRLEYRKQNRQGDQVQQAQQVGESYKVGPVNDFRDHIDIMLDLLALAFQTDTTRVCSMMMAGGISNQSFSFLDGVDEEHHTVSHHENLPRKIAQYQKINQWYVERFVKFVTRLRSIEEGDGTLLDNCMILFGSGMSDGNRHDPYNLPILLAGKGGNRITSGQHLPAPGGSAPLCNLYVSMLNNFGIQTKSFGDSTSALLS
jgi:hypothetical protein